jgi:hypothetical protein
LIIGGLIAYTWVLSSYYNMPANSSSLTVENVVFPSDNFTYFNVTVLNPSNSVSDLNITGFQVNVESLDQTFSVGTTEPAVPFLLRIGAKQNFTCLENWSPFAGQNVIVEPLFTAKASLQSPIYATPMVDLVLSASINTAEDAEHFNLTVQNSPESVINLNVTEIMVFGEQVSSTPSVPISLPVGQQQVFNCAYDLADIGGQNLTVTILTDVGYEQSYVTNAIQSAYLSISSVNFDYTDASYFNITVSSQPSSTVPATLSAVNVTLVDNTTLALKTFPPLNSLLFSVAPNGNLTVMCFWNWSGYRNEQVIVQAFTTQGFTVQNMTVTTPPAVIWSVNNVQFDLADLDHFIVNVTNAPVSQQEINVTGVDFNQNTTSLNPVVVAPANSSIVVCSFNWTSFVGSSVNVTVHATYGQNETTTSQTLALPYFKVTNASFSNFPPGNPYVNITLFDSQYSPINANITQISVTANNVTSLIDETLVVPSISSSGYLLPIGNEVTFVCPWNWSVYLGQNVTFTVQATQGPPASATFQVG